MFRFCVIFVVATAAAPVLASRGIDADETAPQLSRIDTLELPGLTAGCHICEWRPKLNQMPAGEQCGAYDSGVANVGLFECGFSQDCQRQCHFLRCGTTN